MDFKSPIIPVYLASFCALGAMSMGVRTLYNRPKAASVFGIPTPSPWTTMFGSRNIVIGSSMLIFAYLRERQALGIMAVLGGLARAVDVTLIRQEGEAQRRKANIHTIAGMLWTAVGAWLLGTRG